MIRNLLARPRLLDSRRAVVMVGSPENWQGFPPLPKYIQDGARRIALEKTIMASSGEAAILGDGSFAHSVNANGSVDFKSAREDAGEDAGEFGLAFEIPPVEGKNTCMVRVNFDKNSFITLELTREGGETIDTCSLAPGGGQSADLFVPLPDGSFQARLLFRPRYRQPGCSIHDMELWYY